MNSATDKKDIFCPFCQEFGAGKNSYRTIHSSGSYTLFPTLGCFTAGYCLLIPNLHLGAFAHLSVPMLGLLEPEVKNIRMKIERVTGRKVIIAEHGEGRACTGQPGCNCLSHAHLHFIPVNNPGAVFMQYCRQGGFPQVYSSLQQLNQLQGPYLYLDVGTDQHLVWENCTAFPKQFCRIVSASDNGVEEKWNWRLHPCKELIVETLAMLRPTLRLDSSVA